MKKKILSMILATTMVLSLFGCGASEEKNSDVSKEPVAEDAGLADEATTEQEPVTLKFYCLVGAQDDQQVVFDKLNEYFQEKYNTTVEWNFISGEFDDKMSVIIGSGEEYDACWTSNWRNDYLTNVEREAFVDISGMLKDFPALYESMPEAFWKAATVNGGIYAVPNQQIAARQLAGMIPTEYLEGTGFSADDFNETDTLADHVDYYKAAKEQYGALFGGINWNQIPYYLGYEMLGSNNLGVAVKYNDPEGKVVNLYETEEFKQMCLELAELEKEGLLDGMMGIDGDQETSQMTAKRAAAYYAGTMKPGGDIEQSNRYGYPITMVGAGTPYLTTGGIIATMWGISQTSQHPERVLQILELLATDEYVMNMISYGIEGVHYEFVDAEKTTIRTIEGSGYAPNCSWALGNVFLTYAYEGQPADVWEQTKELNASADVSPLIGFSYSIANVEAEATNIINAVSTYKSVITGTVDVESTIADMVDKMNTAGLDKVIEDAQAQVDEFLGK